MSKRNEFTAGKYIAEYVQLKDDALDARLSLLTRLYMYGSSDVNAAFDAWSLADKAWGSSFTEMSNAPEPEDIEAWTKLRQGVRDAATFAKAAEQKLIITISLATQNVPKRTRN